MVAIVERKALMELSREDLADDVTHESDVAGFDASRHLGRVSLYADLLAAIQGEPPEMVYVVTPETGFEPQAYRVANFAAYYRRVGRRLEEAAANGFDGGLYPEPTAHCEICRWREDCNGKRRADDHLSLVAGISKSQIGELAKHAVCSTAALAVLPLPLPWKPERGAAHTYERVREQARIQVEGRSKGCTIHESLPVVPGFGLCILPLPSPGDVFLDFEGEELQSQGGSKLGAVTGISFEDRTIDIKKRKDTNSFHPTAVFAHEVINSRVLADALLRIGEFVASAGIEGTGPFEAARDLLMQAVPRAEGKALQQPGETSLQAATRLSTQAFITCKSGVSLESASKRQESRSGRMA